MTDDVAVRAGDGWSIPVSVETFERLNKARLPGESDDDLLTRLLADRDRPDPEFERFKRSERAKHSAAMRKTPA